LGIQPSRTISSKEYAAIWKRYDKNKNRLTLKQAEKFMKDFSSAVGVKYDKNDASSLIKKADIDNSGWLDYDQFKKLFFSVSQNSHVNLTESLQNALNIVDTEPLSSDEEDRKKPKKRPSVMDLKEMQLKNSGENNNKNNAIVDQHSIKPKQSSTEELDQIFDKYIVFESDKEEDLLKDSGIIKYSQDMEIAEESDPTLLLIAWKLNVNQPTVWTFSRQEFVQGWDKFKCYTLEQMRQQTKKWREELKNEETFKLFYNFVFDYLREDKKILSVEEALITWELLEINKRWPLMDQWVSWLQEKEKKEKSAVTRDLWRLFLKFILANPTSISTYDEDGCWPSVIDDFVDYLKQKS